MADCAECEHRATMVWLLILLVSMTSIVAIVSTTKWLDLKRSLQTAENQP